MTEGVFFGGFWAPVPFSDLPSATRHLNAGLGHVSGGKGNVETRSSAWVVRSRGTENQQAKQERIWHGRDTKSSGQILDDHRCVQGTHPDQSNYRLPIQIARLQLELRLSHVACDQCISSHITKNTGPRGPDS